LPSIKFHTHLPYSIPALQLFSSLVFISSSMQAAPPPNTPNLPPPIAPLVSDVLIQSLEGPKSRQSELKFIFQVGWQFLKGFRALHFVGPCVTVFGSARFGPDHRYYELARKIGRAISGLGFTVMTGGGPGLMEAANRGVFEAGGRSVGCNIRLPYEQQPNRYMQQKVTINFFFVRKVLLVKYSYAFVVMPGGWGTMDELFETLTLVQTGILHHFPVVLMDRESMLAGHQRQGLAVGITAHAQFDNMKRVGAPGGNTGGLILNGRTDSTGGSEGDLAADAIVDRGQQLQRRFPHHPNVQLSVITTHIPIVRIRITR
jgi:uncharacterized protein (TIGR00730 family)